MSVGDGFKPGGDVGLEPGDDMAPFGAGGPNDERVASPRSGSSAISRDCRAFSTFAAAYESRVRI